MNCGKESVSQKTLEMLEILSYRNRCIGRWNMDPGLYRDVKSCEETQNFLSLKGQMLINRLKHDLGDVKSGKIIIFFFCQLFCISVY